MLYPCTIFSSVCSSRGDRQPLQAPLECYIAVLASAPIIHRPAHLQLGIYIFHFPCTIFLISTTLPIAAPDECPTPPLCAHLPLPRWPNRPGTHPKLSPTVHTGFLCRKRDAGFAVFAPRYRFLGEEFCPTFLRSFLRGARIGVKRFGANGRLGRRHVCGGLARSIIVCRR